MNAGLIVPDAADPVYVGPDVLAGSIELRIGESLPGKSRYAILLPSEARKIAIALLKTAEMIDEGQILLPRSESGSEAGV